MKRKPAILLGITAIVILMVLSIPMLYNNRLKSTAFKTKGLDYLPTEEQEQEGDPITDDEEGKGEGEQGFDLSKEEELELFSTPFSIPQEISFDNSILTLNEGKEKGYFDHVFEDRALEDMLTNNYGTNVADYEVQNNKGEIVKIKDMKEEGKATIIILGRPTCPYCVELWKDIYNDPVEGANIIELTTEGVPSEIKAFLEDNNLSSMYDKFYYNVRHLMSVLEIEYVPIAFYLNDDFTVVNVSSHSTDSRTMEKIIKNIPNMK